MQAKKKQNKPQGYYCWVCGEHKANEKFSGHGHATRMCKQCSSLPVAERNKLVAVRKAGNMAFRYLNEQEIKWLRKKMNDPRPEVQATAREAHSIKFPRYERSIIKKGLTAFSFELFIHGDIWNEWGDKIAVHMLISMDDNGIIRRNDYNASKNGHESNVHIEAKEARSFIKAVIHHLDALFWDEDLSDAESGNDEDIDLLPDLDGNCLDFENKDSDEGSESEVLTTSQEYREPIWSLRLELNSGEEKKITFYNQMHDEPQELFWSLMEYFEPEDGVFDEDVN